MKSLSATFVFAASFALSACGSTDHSLSGSAQPSINLDDNDLITLKGKCSDELRHRLPRGFSDHCYVHQGLKRQVRVYRPSTKSHGTKATALVVALHGGGGSGEQASDVKKSGLGVYTQLAEEKNLIIVYPTATSDSTGKNGWNDCRSDDQTKSGVNDSTFLADLITEMKQNLQLSKNQIFISGHSNGAMMSFRMALEYSNLIGGIATSAGSIAKHPIPGPCSEGPRNPVPVIMTHGSEDRFVPPEGGCVANLRGKNTCERGYVLSARESIEFWLKANAQTNSPAQVRTVDMNKRDGGAAVESKYTEGAAPVVSWLLNGAGHPIPSTTVKVRPFIVGKQNRDIEFAREAWSFFESQLK